MHHMIKIGIKIVCVCHSSWHDACDLYNNACDIYVSRLLALYTIFMHEPTYHLNLDVYVLYEHNIMQELNVLNHN